MSDTLANTFRSDFLVWSGGFPPESVCQIYVYIDYARPNDTDENDVREILTAWMNQDSG